jgi:hypothetical protein
MIRDDFYWDELPLEVLIRFDALPRPVQKLLAIHLKPNEDPQAYCKERIKRLKSVGWSTEDMVDLCPASNSMPVRGLTFARKRRASVRPGPDPI